TGSTTADLSGKGNNGSTNATWSTAGKYGKALTFDGNGTWVNVPDSNSLDLTVAMTLEAWVNPAALGGWRTVILKEAGADEVYSLYANDDVSRPNSSIRINNGYNTVLGSSILPLNTWSYLSSTYDGAALRLYVNGTLIRSTPVSGNIQVSNGALKIGGNSIWGEFFTGLIDEVRIYNRALAQSEIQTDMSTPVGGVADSQPPTAPTNLTASGGIGSVSLSWSASTDNVGVANYNVHRSTTPNFTPSTANRIAQPTSTNYTDSGMPAGTYYYRVTAQDAAGNVSAASNQASGTASADTVAPTVSITAPANGATVSGTVTVSANASDNVGVAGVQFLL